MVQPGMDLSHCDFWTIDAFQRINTWTSETLFHRYSGRGLEARAAKWPCLPEVIAAVALLSSLQLL